MNILRKLIKSRKDDITNLWVVRDENVACFYLWRFGECIGVVGEMNAVLRKKGEHFIIYESESCNYVVACVSWISPGRVVGFNPINGWKVKDDQQ